MATRRSVEPQSFETQPQEAFKSCSVMEEERKTREMEARFAHAAKQAERQAERRFSQGGAG